MSILSGYNKYKRYIKTTDGYKLVSQWTSSNTVEMDDGNTLETNLGAIQGITSSLATDNENYALSASGGMRLQEQIDYIVDTRLWIMNNNLEDAQEEITYIEENIDEIEETIGKIKEYKYDIAAGTSLTFTSSNHSIFLFTISANNKNLRYYGIISFGSYNGATVNDIYRGASISVDIDTTNANNITITNNSTNTTAKMNFIRIGGDSELSEIIT